MFVTLAASVVLAAPPAPEPTPHPEPGDPSTAERGLRTGQPTAGARRPAEPERVLVVGAPVTGSEPGRVAGLGDCLQESAPAAWQVLDRRDAAVTWATVPQLVASMGEHHVGRVVVALPADPAPEIDVAALKKALDSFEVAPRLVWLLYALPIPPDRRGPAYQELSALAANKLTLSILDPWQKLGETEANAVSGSWVRDGGVTASGEVRVASVACNAVLPRTP